MKKTYTKKQIIEAIKYWEKQLAQINEANDNLSEAYALIDKFIKDNINRQDDLTSLFDLCEKRWEEDQNQRPARMKSQWNQLILRSGDSIYETIQRLCKSYGVKRAGWDIRFKKEPDMFRISFGVEYSTTHYDMSNGDSWPVARSRDFYIIKPVGNPKLTDEFMNSIGIKDWQYISDDGSSVWGKQLKKQMQIVASAFRKRLESALSQIHYFAPEELNRLVEKLRFLVDDKLKHGDKKRTQQSKLSQMSVNQADKAKAQKLFNIRKTKYFGKNISINDIDDDKFTDFVANYFNCVDQHKLYDLIMDNLIKMYDGVEDSDEYSSYEFSVDSEPDDDSFFETVGEMISDIMEDMVDKHVKTDDEFKHIADNRMAELMSRFEREFNRCSLDDGSRTSFGVWHFKG